MAYDEHGNYFFSPGTDAEDAQTLQDAEKMESVLQLKAAQTAQLNNAKFAQKAWAEALEGAGLTQDEYNAICSDDPQLAGEVITKSMRLTAKTVAASKGQKAVPTQTETGSVETRRRVLEDTGSQAKLDAIRQKAHKGEATEADEMDAVEMIIGRAV